MGEPNVHRLRSNEIDERPVYAAVERALGERPLALIARETLAPRFVWLAALPGERSVYIKAEHEAEGDEALLLEAWAIDRVREHGVHAPASIALDETREIFPGVLLIQEVMQGAPLTPVWRKPKDDEIMLPREQARAAWRATGELLRRTHEITIERGYGRLDDPHFARTGEVRGEHATWVEAVLKPALDAIAFMEGVHSMPADQLAAARRALEAHADVFADFSDTCLLHGDLAAKHIFVDPENGTVTGIIDWGDRESGDPAHDLANIALWEDDERMEWALEGYGGDSLHLRRRMLAYTIADGLRVVGKRFRQGRIGAAESTASWLLPRVMRAIST